MWEIKRFGTLFADGEPQDSNFVYLGENLDIKDSVPGKEITWILVNGLFIADRVSCRQISWNCLNDMGFVEGRKIIVDGNKYLCRLPQVGRFKKDPNEWDNAVKATSPKDELWHWKDQFFWGQDSVNWGDGLRMMVGYYGPYRREAKPSETSLSINVGFRPVLEPIEEGLTLCDDLIGDRLVFYLPDGYGVVGALNAITEYDVIIEPENPNYQDKPRLYVKLPDGRLAIDRGIIKKIKHSMFREMQASERKGCTCKSCGTFWYSETLQNARWMGTPFLWKKQSGVLICPECYDEMRAAFVKDPKKFKEWKRETLVQP